MISGSGNVAIYACEKATAAGRQGGGHVRLQRLYLRSRTASTWTLVKQIKEVERGRIKEYAGASSRRRATTRAAAASGRIPCDIALPCATQNELDADDAPRPWCRTAAIAVAEGANMPSTPEAIADLPGSRACSLPPPRPPTPAAWPPPRLEMSQNSMRSAWTFEEVDEKLQRHHGGHLPQRRQRRRGIRHARQPGGRRQHRRLPEGGRRHAGPGRGVRSPKNRKSRGPSGPGSSSSRDLSIPK